MSLICKYRNLHCQRWKFDYYPLYITHALQKRGTGSQAPQSVDMLSSQSRIHTSFINVRLLLKKIDGFSQTDQQSYTFALPCLLISSRLGATHDPHVYMYALYSYIYGQQSPGFDMKLLCSLVMIVSGIWGWWQDGCMVGWLGGERMMALVKIGNRVLVDDGWWWRTLVNDRGERELLLLLIVGGGGGGCACENGWLVGW